MDQEPNNNMKDDGDLHAEPSDEGARANAPQRIKKRKAGMQINGRSIALGMMVVGFVGLAIMLGSQYLEGFLSADSVDVPLIQADNTPDRIIPEDRGGAKISHQDKSIFNRIDPTKKMDVETVIVEKTEKPLLQKKHDEMKMQSADQGGNSTKIVEVERVEVYERNADSANAPGLVKQEKPVFKVENEPKNEEMSKMADAQQMMPEKPSRATAVEEETVKVVDTMAENKAKMAEVKQTAKEVMKADAEPKLKMDMMNKVDDSVNENSVIQKAEAKSVMPKATPAQPSATAAPTLAAGETGYRVQLGSVRDKQAAEKEWNRLKAQNQELKGMDLFVSQVTIPQKGEFFRIQAGKMTKGEASAVCQALKKKNVACFVAKG
jgi:hypothetical protein